MAFGQMWYLCAFPVSFWATRGAPMDHQGIRASAPDCHETDWFRYDPRRIAPSDLAACYGRRPRGSPQPQCRHYVTRTASPCLTESTGCFTGRRIARANAPETKACYDSLSKVTGNPARAER